jgi:hypothetical protein
MEWNRRYNGQRRPLMILTRLTWNEFRSTLGIGIGLNLWAERRCMMISLRSDGIQFRKNMLSGLERSA